MPFADLEKAVLDKIQNPSNPYGQKPQYDFNEQMSQLASAFEKKQTTDKIMGAFEQTMKGVDHLDPYQQSQVQVFSKNRLANGFGASIAGTIGGFAQRFIPINIGISGAPIVLGAWALRKFVLKGGTGADIADGALIAGLGIAFAGFTSGGLGFLGVGGQQAPAQAPSTGENVNF